MCKLEKNPEAKSLWKSRADQKTGPETMEESRERKTTPERKNSWFQVPFSLFLNFQ